MSKTEMETLSNLNELRQQNHANMHTVRGLVNIIVFIWSFFDQATALSDVRS